MINRQHLSWIANVGLLTAALWFLTKTLLVNWQEVQALELQSQAWLYGGVALGIALIAQVMEALVWGWLLSDLQISVPARWSIVTFIKYSPAKYIPGNIWHLYGRVMAAQKRGLSFESVTLSILLEPLFIIAGALGVAILKPSHLSVEVSILGAIVLVVHPRVLPPLWGWFRRLQGKEINQIGLQRYPLRELLGAGTFIGLRGLVFLCAVMAFAPVPFETFRPLIGGFSLACLLRMVIPTPAGLGVLEASTITALSGYFSPGLLLAAVTVYRLVTICAELIGAGCACLVGLDSGTQTAGLTSSVSYLPQFHRRLWQLIVQLPGVSGQLRAKRSTV